MKKKRLHKITNAKFATFVLSGSITLLSGCVTVGHEFPAGQVSSIKIGTTTQNEITNLFGTPWRTGVENGLQTWTYGDYSYSLLGESNSEDLVIRFNKNNVVSSYTFNSTKRSR